jgi:hypothetical protein
LDGYGPGMGKPQPTTSGHKAELPAQTRPDVWLLPARAWVARGRIYWSGMPESGPPPALPNPTPNPHPAKVDVVPVARKRLTVADGPGLLSAFRDLATAPHSTVLEFVESLGVPEICSHGALPYHKGGRSPCMPTRRANTDVESLPITAITRMAAGFDALCRVGRVLRPTGARPAPRETWLDVWRAFDDKGWLERFGPTDAGWNGFGLEQQRHEFVRYLNRLLDETRVSLRVEWVRIGEPTHPPSLRVASALLIACVANELVRQETSGAFDGQDGQCAVCGRHYNKSKPQQKACSPQCRRRMKTQYMAATRKGASR